MLQTWNDGDKSRSSTTTLEFVSFWCIRQLLAKHTDSSRHSGKWSLLHSLPFFLSLPFSMELKMKIAAAWFAVATMSLSLSLSLPATLPFFFVYSIRWPFEWRTNISNSSLLGWLGWRVKTFSLSLILLRVKERNVRSLFHFHTFSILIIFKANRFKLFVSVSVWQQNQRTNEQMNVQ